MLNVKVTSFMFLIFGLYSITIVECEEFNTKEAQKLVIEVFNHMKPMLQGDKKLELDKCESSINEASTPDDLNNVVEVLTDDQIDHTFVLTQMDVEKRNELIGVINDFTPKYQKLLTDSGNTNKPVPFQDLLQELNTANEKKGIFSLVHQEFNTEEAQKLVIEVFNHMKPMLQGDKKLELDKCESSINEASTPDELNNVVEILTDDQIDHTFVLTQMDVEKRKELIDVINDFTPKYQKLLTDSGNTNKPVPFQDLLQELNTANEKKDLLRELNTANEKKDSTDKDSQIV